LHRKRWRKSDADVVVKRMGIKAVLPLCLAGEREQEEGMRTAYFACYSNSEAASPRVGPIKALEPSLAGKIADRTCMLHHSNN